MTFVEGDLGKLIIERARKLGFEAEADGDARGRAVVGLDHAERMARTDDQPVAAVERKTDSPVLTFARHGHLGGAEGGRLHIDR